MTRPLCVLGLIVLAIGTTPASAAVYSMGDPGVGTPVFSNNFFFGADALGGGVLSFMNESGNQWNTLNISVTEPSATAITLLPNPFFNASQFSSQSLGDGNSRFTIGLFNTGEGGSGISNDEFFTINLNDLIGNSQNTDPVGAGGWGPGAEFSATANTAPGTPSPADVSPEPGSMLLVATGLGLVGWGSQRYRKIRA